MLAGYQRFVAYVYEYRKGKKDGSSGYVRVEARGQECRIEVHLRCAGLEPGSRCRVYGFVRREGLMDGILIGSCVTGREQIECMLETDTENIGGMGKNLRELGGMLLISDAGGFWGTEWDDQSIRPDNFREWKKEETDAHKEKKTEKGEGQRGETAEAEEDQKAGFSAEVQEKQNAADKIMTVEEVQEEVDGISVSTMNQETKKGLQENRAILAEDEPKISEAGRPHPGQAHPEPGSRPPESPRPGSPSPGRQDHRNHRGRPGQLQASPMIHSMTDSLQTAVRSNHPTAVPYAEKTAVSVTTVLSCTDIRILAIFCCAEITGVSTYWESPAVTASRNASWQTCLAFPIFGKVRRSTFRAEKVDTGTALLISEWKIEHLYRSIPRISTTGIVRDRISR